MNGSKNTLLIVCSILVVVILVFYLARVYNESREKEYQSNGGNGFWESLFNNAANIVDAGGRHTAAATTSLGNAISSVIATSKGDTTLSRYGYAEQKIDYGPYILGAGIVAAAGVVAAVTLTKK